MMKGHIKILMLGFMALMLGACADSSSDVAPGGTTGQGGSLARFGIANDNLYVVDFNALHVYDISQTNSLQYQNKVEIGIGIETIFPYGDNIFIGAVDAMYIYDIAQPEQPSLLSRFAHFVSCDPVVVQGDYAYVTLRVSGCRPGNNEDVLDIIDISDLANPRVVASYPVTSPYGLGIDDNTLFLCEGDNGLKVYDVTDPVDLKLMHHFPEVNAYDVIPNSSVLVLTGDDGIFQYDYSDPTDFKLLSQLN